MTLKEKDMWGQNLNDLAYMSAKILGEMVNLQKVNWPKSQLAQKSQLTKNTNHSIVVILCSDAQVDFLASWLFGQLTFWRLTISLSIIRKGSFTFPKFLAPSRCNIADVYAFVLLALATLGDVTHIGSFLLVSHHSRGKRQAGLGHNRWQFRGKLWQCKYE